MPHVRAQAVQIAERRLDHSPLLVERSGPCDRSRFTGAIPGRTGDGESRDPRAENALLQIAQRCWESVDPFGSAQLMHCNTDRLLIDLWNDAKLSAHDTASAAARAVLLVQLAEIVGAGNRPVEIEGVIDQLAMGPGDSERRELRNQLVLWMLVGLRRSGGQLPAHLSRRSLVREWWFT